MRRTSKGVKDIHYNPHLVHKVSVKIINKNIPDAKLLLGHYLKKYPDDEIALLHLARALVKSGKEVEGKELAEYVFEGNRFHNRKAYLSACFVYSCILIDLGEFDKAEELILKFLNFHDVRLTLEDYTMSISNLLHIYQKQGRYYEIISFIELNPVATKQLLFIPKLAQAYFYCQDFEYALKILDDNYDKLDDAQKVVSDYVYGRTYFEMYNTGVVNDISYMVEAKNHFHKVLSKKSNYYYAACYFLSDIYRIIGDDNKAIYYANESLNSSSAQSYIDDVDENLVYFVKAQVYIKIGDFKSAKIFVDRITDDLLRNRALIIYTYSTKDFDGCIHHCEYAFVNGTMNFMKSDLEFYVSSLIRKGEYEKAKDYVRPEANNVLSQKFREKCRTLISVKESNPVYKPESYTSKQLTKYNFKTSIFHISDKHIGGEFPHFNDEEQLLKAYNYARQNIQPKKGMPSKLLDVHYLQLPNCGSYENGKCNALRVVTIPGTNNIITMYPVVENRNYEQLEVISARQTDLVRFRSMDDIQPDYKYSLIEDNIEVIPGETVEDTFMRHMGYEFNPDRFVIRQGDGADGLYDDEPINTISIWSKSIHTERTKAFTKKYGK